MAVETGGGHSPLEQFKVFEVVPIHVGHLILSITNSAVWMMAAVIIITLFTTLFIRRRALVPGRMQSLVEISYEFVANMVRDNVGSEGRAYFPFVFSLFMFLLVCNLMGLLPYGFTVTSQIIVTFGLALTIFIGVTVIGFIKHGLGFCKFFLPAGVPPALAPLVIPIEILSYLMRPVSLALRLFANMTAGHTMLKVFAGFVAALGAVEILGAHNLVLGGIPLVVITALTLLEVIIAFLQAYVFAILSCIYLYDALHMH